MSEMDVRRPAGLNRVLAAVAGTLALIACRSRRTPSLARDAAVPGFDASPIASDRTTGSGTGDTGATPPFGVSTDEVGIRRLHINERFAPDP